MWDEGRNAVNAIEMAENGKLLIRYYQGAPETWEVKPPLLTWLQALCLKVFGYGELAIRLPSALFAFFTLFLIVRFFRRVLAIPWAGFSAALVLLASSGYIGHHIARTGDHDAVLTFFLTWSILSLYQFLYDDKRTARHLAILTLALVLAVLTKGVAGLFFLPGMLLFVVLSGKAGMVFRYGPTYLAIGSFLLLVLGYYGGRELLQPGYLHDVWIWELFPRFSNSSGNHDVHQHEFLFYLQGMVNGRFLPWIFVLPVTMVVSVWHAMPGIRQFSRVLTICLLVIFITLSSGSTAYWYDAPMYPLMAMLIGIGGQVIFEGISKAISPSKWARIFLIVALVVGLFFPPISQLFRNHTSLPTQHPGEKYGFLFEKMHRHHPEIRQFRVLHAGYNSAVLFYEKSYEKQFAYQIEVSHRMEGLASGQFIMSCSDSILQVLTTRFSLDTVESRGPCQMVRLGVGRSQP